MSATTQDTFALFDDGTGVYALSVINSTYASLKQGLICYGEPLDFTLRGADGKLYSFTNNVQAPPQQPVPNPVISPYIGGGGEFITTTSYPTNTISNPLSNSDYSLYLLLVSYFGLVYWRHGGILKVAHHIKPYKAHK